MPCPAHPESVGESVGQCSRACEGSFPLRGVRPARSAQAFNTTWYANAARKSKTKWYVQARVYNRETRKSTTVMLHRIILGLTDPAIEAHHKDNDGLNNRRRNLEPLTHIQNLRAGRKHSKRCGLTWDKIDEGRKLAIEYRLERQIAATVATVFDVTRIHMYRIRNGQAQSSPAKAYRAAVALAGVRSLQELKAVWPRPSRKQWGVFQTGMF